MRITVHLDCRSGEVIAAAEYEKKFQEVYEDIKEDEDEFGYWLNKNYKPTDIWRLTEEEKDDILEKWVECAKTVAKETLEDDWSAYRFTLEELLGQSFEEKIQELILEYSKK
jgi:hypothetical protein